MDIILLMGKMMLKKYNIDTKHSWITVNIDQLTVDKTEKLLEKLDMDEETLGYALDKKERAHVEFTSETQTLTLVYNALNPNKEENHFTTLPVTFTVKGNKMITFYSKETEYVIEQMNEILTSNKELSIYQFLFTGLFIISESYFPFIEKMDKSKDEINRKLREKTNKKDLFALSDIETGVVYLVSAANQNTLLLEQIKSKSLYRILTEGEKEQLEDALIEAKQLSGMTQINAQVLQQLSSTYNNILNNNLNDNMTTLTIVSILLATLAVITGFFGMNVPLPLTHEHDAWIIIIIFAVVVWFLYAAILRYVTRSK